MGGARGAVKAACAVSTKEWGVFLISSLLRFHIAPHTPPHIHVVPSPFFSPYHPPLPLLPPSSSSPGVGGDDEPSHYKDPQRGEHGDTGAGAGGKLVARLHAPCDAVLAGGAAGGASVQVAVEAGHDRYKAREGDAREGEAREGDAREAIRLERMNARLVRGRCSLSYLSTNKVCV